MKDRVQVLGEESNDMLTDRGRPSRREAGISALVLVVLGGFVLALLTKRTDNAYLGLGLIGVALVAVSFPFALAALIPYGSIRRLVVILGVAFLWAVTALGGLMLVSMLVNIPAWQYHEASTLVLRHLVGFGLQVVAAYFLGYRFVRGAAS